MKFGALKMTKCLILGGEGMLGHMLVKYMKSLKDFEVFFTSRDKLNFDSVYSKIPFIINTSDIKSLCFPIS